MCEELWPRHSDEGKGGDTARTNPKKSVGRATDDTPLRALGSTQAIDRSVIRGIWAEHLLCTSASSPVLHHVALGEDGEEKENKPADLQVLPLCVHSCGMQRRRVRLKGTLLSTAASAHRSKNVAGA